MYCLRLWHAPKCRFNFPTNWYVVDPLQLSTISREGQYWFDQLQFRTDVTRIVIVNLKTEEVQEYIKPAVPRKLWHFGW